MSDVILKILEIVIYIVIGLIFFIIGYKILARNKNYNLNKKDYYYLIILAVFSIILICNYINFNLFSKSR